MGIVVLVVEVVMDLVEDIVNGDKFTVGVGMGANEASYVDTKGRGIPSVKEKPLLFVHGLIVLFCMISSVLFGIPI